VSFYIGCCIGSVLTLVVLSPVIVFVFRRVLAMRLFEQEKRLREEHRKDFETLYNQINHEGHVPHARTALGLLALMSSALRRLLLHSIELFKAQDWNTSKIITEIHGITGSELLLAKQEIEAIISAIETATRDHNHKQY
jgi:hypothetical protein